MDFLNTTPFSGDRVKPVYNERRPWDPKIVAVVDKWSLLFNKSEKRDSKVVVVVDRRTLFGGSH